MKPKQNQTATQAVMRALAQELVNTSPVTTSRAHIAHHVYALFHQTRGRYASEKTFREVVRRVRCEEADARAYKQNQTALQHLMCEVARCLIKNNETNISKHAVAVSVYSLFKHAPGCYESEAVFCQVVKCLD